MPTWKKVVVSGSAISQLANDANYLAAAFSASIDTRIDTLEAGGDLSGSAHLRRNQLSGSSAAALRTEYVASTATLSGSAHAQRVIEKSIASGLVTSLTDGAVATNAASINTLSGSAHSDRVSKIASGIDTISGSGHSQRVAISASLAATIAAGGTANAVSASAHLDRIAKVSVLSGSAHTDRIAKVNVLSASAASATNSLSASVRIYTDAKVAGLVDSAPEALDTLAELATALGGDSNISASLATNIGLRHKTSEHLTYSASNASALRTEYVASTAALSGSAHAQRVVEKGIAAGLVTALSNGAVATNASAITTLSSSAHTARVSGASSGSAHTQREALVSTLSGSAHAQRVIEKNIAAGLVTGLSNGAVATNASAITTLSGSSASALGNLSGSSAAALRTEYKAAVAASIDAAPEALDTLNELAAALGDDGNFSASLHTATSLRFKTADHLIYSASSAAAGRVELNAVSASAHTARVSGASSGSAHTQREALVSALSSSAATANNSSAITVRNLVGQAVVASSFQGDGSNLSNITVDQNATVASAFTSVTSHAVTHNFGTKNVIVQVYDDNDQVIIPASITSTNTNTSTVTFDGASTGIVVVARGGHVVSGSIPYSNLINTPSASFSSRINALSGSGHADRIAKISVLSGSAHTDRIARVNILSGSAHSDRIARVNILSGSAHSDRASKIASAIDTLSGSAHTARVSGASSGSAHTQREALVATLSGSALAARNTLSASVQVYTDAKVAGLVNSSPEALDTLAELATALGGDANISASLATSIGNRFKTADHLTYSASNASALRAEYVAGDSALSGSAHAQRVIEKNIASGLVTALSNGAVATNAAAITTLSGSGHTNVINKISVISASLAATISAGGTATVVSASAHTDRIAKIGVLSGSAHTDRIAKIGVLSGSAHAQRVIEKNIAAGLVTGLSNGAVATNAASISTLSGSAHAQRVIEKGIAAGLVTALSDGAVATNAASISTLSGSAHSDRVAKINVLSGSAHSDRASKITSAIDIISESAHIDRVAKVNVLSASAHTARGSISSQFTIAGGSGSDTFETGQTLTFAGTANEIETSVTNNQVAVGIVTNPTLTGNVTVTGNLIVTGDTIEQQVTNLNVEDKFILINSGSASGDSGIIFGGSGGSANSGTALFFDDTADTLALGTAVAFGATTAAVAAKVGTITESTSVPTAAPTYQGVGSMHVKTDSQDIYIYTAD